MGRCRWCFRRPLMKSLASIIQVGTALLVLSLTLTACQKKRDASLPYGADRELLGISQYEGKDYELKTKELLKAANTGTLKVQDARTDAKAQVRNFDYVDYDAKDPLKLTDKTLMLGRPNFEYKVRYVFDGNLLKVMKVGAAKDFSSDEITSAVDAGQDLKMVPIVSYNVAYFSVDTSRNDLKQKTSKLELVSQQGRSSSTHFKVDLNSKTRAVFLSKRTVLPANYFTADGESDWYFAFTIVSQNYKESRGSLGSMISIDKYGREAFKVRARKVEDKILFYNVGIDEKLEKSLQKREENQTAVLTIPADFIDYRMGEAGKTSSVKEESHKERAWDKRDFSDLKLKDIKVPAVALEISEIKDVQLDDGYFSFLVESESLGGLVRVSLLSQKSYESKLISQGAKPYKNQKKVYFRADQKLFGYFSTQAESIGGLDRSKLEQTEKMVFINRFNPTRKEIEYRLNSDAPAWMEELVLAAGNAWNSTFKAAGSTIKIRVADDSGKVLRGSAGDLRYSLINMYGDVDGGGQWGGFGPVLNDPQTGEIIMATSNINLTDRLEGMERTLNSYILAVKGELDKKYIWGLPVPSLRPVIDVANKTLQFVGSRIPFLKDKVLHVYDSNNRTFVRNVKVVQPASLKAMKPNMANQHLMEQSFQAINGNITEQVKAICPDLETYALGLKSSQTDGDTERELKLIKECAVELSKPSIISVILHEMGHNLGLRHNFYGSTDKPNFWGPVDLKLGSKTVKTQWESSSVMDYMSMNYENMVQPGRYDVAAIRWGYVDQIEDASGKVVAVNPAKSTREQVQKNYRLYKYCTDEDVDVAVADPMCARSDVGIDPVQIVANLILEYDSSMATWNHRHKRDEMMDMMSASMYRSKKFLEPMAKFYEQWRLILASQAGPGNEYLESIQTKEAYESLVKKALNPEVVGKDKAALHAQYQKTANLIFSFLVRVAFLPDYSCITERANGEASTIQMFPFSKIQKDIFSSTGKTVKSCQDQEVSTYLKTTKNAKTFAEAGYPFDSIYSDLSNVEVSMSTYQITDRPEILGVAQDRANAVVMLVSRSSELYHSKYSYKYAPNFMDELPFRDFLTQKVVQRLTEGVPVQEIGLDKAVQKELPPLMSPAFETEKPLLSLMFQALRFGQDIPNKTVVTNQRMEKYAIVPYYMLDGTGEPECAMINGYNWCATDQHVVSKSLVKKLKSLQQIKASFKIDDTVVAQFVELTKDLIPQKGQFQELDATFLDKVQERIAATEEKNPAVAEQLSLLMQVVFGPEYSIWEKGIAKKVEKLQKDDLSVAEVTQRVEELKKAKIKELAVRIGVTDKYKELTPEVFKERITEFVKKIRKNAETYQADPTELDAQADIILEALMGGRSN